MTDLEAAQGPAPSPPQGTGRQGARRRSKAPAAPPPAAAAPARASCAAGSAALRAAAALRQRRVPAGHGTRDQHARDRRAGSWRLPRAPSARIICGHIALGQIKRTGEGGHGLALAGTIIGYVLTGLGILVVVFYIIFFVALFSSGVLEPGTVI